MSLVLNKVKKSFGNMKAVDNVSIEMEEGLYGLLGSNGAGKTTLMRMLCTVLKPTEGSICYDGMDIFKMDAQYRDIIGYLPQEFGFYPNLSVKKYLAYIASLKGLKNKVAERRIDILLETTGMKEHSLKKMKELSGGMKRRVGIIRMKKGRFVGFYWKPVLIKGFQPDSVLSLQLRPYVEAAEKDLATVLGEATEEFSLFQDGENLARYGETALGDLVADALKWKAGKLNLKVDFALTNSGGIRESLPAGKITKGDVLAVLPFDNVLEVVALSGSEVRRLFDYIASIPLGNGAFAQVSREVRVVYDSGRVRTLTIAGRPIEDDKMYYMATCDYVAAGKDGYEAGLENITGRENTSRSLSDVLIEYIQTKGKIIPRVDGRIKFTD